VSLQPPEKTRKLQEALHAQAKSAPTYRFYTLYDKVYRMDVLWHAYERCRANDGSAGVDGQTFEDIEAYGRWEWLGELAEGLSQGDSPRLPEAPSVVGAEAQSAGVEVVTLRGPLPARYAGPPSAPAAAQQPLVCERVKPCPRAGCGKTARPVR